MVVVGLSNSPWGSHWLVVTLCTSAHEMRCHRITIGFGLDPLAGIAGRTAEEHEAEHEHLVRLCQHFLVQPPPADANFFTADLGGLGALRWEKHAEITTYTFIRTELSPSEAASPFDKGSLALTGVPDWWLNSMPGFVISAVHATVIAEEPDSTSTIDIRQYSRHFNRSNFITASTADGGAFRAISDWREHEDGFVRLIVQAVPSWWRDHAAVAMPTAASLQTVRQGLANQAAGQRTAAGKVVQRLIEMEKYRVLALMAQPLATQVCVRVMARGTKMTIPGFIASLSGVTIRYLLASTP